VQQALLAVVETSAQILEVRSHEHIRAPEIVGGTFEVDHVFTIDGTRPRWDNLALFVCVVRGGEPDIATWQRRVDALPVDATILAANDSSFFIEKQQVGPSVARRLNLEELRLELAAYKERIFSPRRLAALRSGQLSFADAATTISPGSLEFVSRHREDLSKALSSAVHEALSAFDDAARKRFTSGVTKDDVLDVALGYLAARILEDKGALGRTSSSLANDPADLISRIMAEGRNGFFKRASEALGGVLRVPGVLDRLAAHLGPATTFALVDHVDVARVYEDLLHQLRATHEASAASWVNLQQHYTPMSLTSRILERLPIERLRPEERYIFDPAAGSGSLLIAATLRLAGMRDSPARNLPEYLSAHVIGNDLDARARDITLVRYCLLQESRLGGDFHLEPVYWQKDYKTFSRSSLDPLRPRVLVANPPFGKDGNKQEAATFIELALPWLDEGALLGLVLPQTFLTQKKGNVESARSLLKDKVDILEVWQLPDGVVGLSARQSVCVLLGQVRGPTSSHPIARAVLAEGTNREVRSNGYLGPAWIAEMDPGSSNWASAVAPLAVRPGRTIPLCDLFEVCVGPTPLKGDKTSAHRTKNGAKPFWNVFWQHEDYVWANPARRPPRPDGEGNEYWRSQWRFNARNHSELLDGHKLIVASSNKNSRRPIQVCYDTSGFWPDHNRLCVAPHHKPIRIAPDGWATLNDDERLLWLLGILSTGLATRQTLRMRDARHSNKDTLRLLPLPATVDPNIFKLMSRIVGAEQRGITDPAPLAKHREDLEKMVEASYGAARKLELHRVGLDPAAQERERERRLESLTVTGQVIKFRISAGRGRVLLHLQGLIDEKNERWIDLPQEMPGWALDGTPFTARLPRDIETFGQLARRRWALHDFAHEPRPYLDIESLVKLIEARARNNAGDAA
jgi:hypothetical protein